MDFKHHTPIVYDIYGELAKHVGKANAISAKDLSSMFYISERELREHINTIRNSTELEKIIGSNSKGYFVCTEEEFKATLATMWRRALSSLDVVKATSKKGGLDNQMKMKLGKYYKDTYESFGD